MITDVQYTAWLSDPTAQRVMLYEVDAQSNGAEVTRYFSNKAYGGGSAATPYLAVVIQDLEIDQSISMDGDAKLSAGTVGLRNKRGAFNAWLTDIWSNRPARAFLGDVRWPRADFHQVFVGRIADIDVGASRDQLLLKFRDVMQRLNTPVIEDKLANDVLRPVTLGEVPNFTPKLKNAATGEYEFNAGAGERVIEGRVDGKPRIITTDLAAGSFTFTSAVGGGAVTCSVQGDKFGGVYRNTVGQLVQRLVTGYGKAGERFTVDDLDVAQLAAFDAANPQAIGLGLSDRTNVLVACALLASSVGAQMLPSRLGKLRLIKFDIPTVAQVDIRPSVQFKGTFQLVARSSAIAAVKLGFCRNYTPQPNLQTSLPPEHKALFATEWRTVTEVDVPTKDAYRLNSEPVQQDTCLMDEGDARAEAKRRLGIVKVPRFTFRFEGKPAALELEVGQAVTLFNDGFEMLRNGKVGLITRLKPNYGTCRVTVEVTV